MIGNDVISVTVRIWIEYFKLNGSNVDDEIDDVLGNIEICKLREDHFGIACNTTYLEWLNNYKNGDVDD